MSDSISIFQSHFDQHIEAARKVKETLLPALDRVAEAIASAFEGGHHLYTMGNGGSAADAQHLAEELIGRFHLERRPLPAIALTSDGTTLTCIANDYGFEEIFARQVNGLVKAGDVVVGISTSGNSENVLRALSAARNLKATTVLFSGETGGKAMALADYALLVPCKTTAVIQEMHIIMIHLLCDYLDRWTQEGK